MAGSPGTGTRSRQSATRRRGAFLLEASARDALPTNLTMGEIAAELHVSVNTVKAHARHLYAKLGSHSRGEAVEEARALRLLAPTASPRSTSA